MVVYDSHEYTRMICEFLKLRYQQDTRRRRWKCSRCESIFVKRVSCVGLCQELKNQQNAIQRSWWQNIHTPSRFAWSKQNKLPTTLSYLQSQARNTHTNKTKLSLIRIENVKHHKCYLDLRWISLGPSIQSPDLSTMCFFFIVFNINLKWTAYC